MNTGTSISAHLTMRAFIIATGVLVVIVAGTFALSRIDFNLFYYFVQEDGILEWSSFWAFSIAGIAFWFKAKKLFQIYGIKSSWFVFGLSLFCIVVALEEISWGQRIFGYQPPTYFLENNFQQELNFHNLLRTEIRKFALNMIIIGYSMFLPMMSSFAKSKAILDKFGFIAPPLLLMPSFIIIFFLLVLYPFRFTGEVVELLLGLTFCYTAFSTLKINKDDVNIFPFKESKSITLSLLLIGILGLLNSHISKNIYAKDPLMLETAKLEVKELQQDFVNLMTGKYGNKVPTCGKHIRVFTYFEGYNDIKNQATVRFRALQGSGLPETRATYFIDPWNSPYWIKDFCTGQGERTVTVYSFGPDRQRQSNDGELKGDDIGFTNVIKYGK